MAVFSTIQVVAQHRADNRHMGRHRHQYFFFLSNKMIFYLNYDSALGGKRQHLQLVLAEWRIIVWQP
jgi:hypothetical protein